MTTTTEALLRELRTILADYVERIDRVGPEAFRLWREDHRDWPRATRGPGRGEAVMGPDAVTLGCIAASWLLAAAAGAFLYYVT